MSQSNQQQEGFCRRKKCWIASFTNAFIYLQILSGCNMPTRPENLYSAEISTDRYKEYSCPNLISEIESLIIYETNLSRAQQKRIDDSQGHAVYYGWGKGDGMDTVELVKARGKIIAIRREMKTKGCN